MVNCVTLRRRKKNEAHTICAFGVPRHYRSRESKQAGRDRLGIYELDGDELKVWVNEGHWKNGKWNGKPRPTEFKDSEAYAVIEFRRIRK